MIKLVGATIYKYKCIEDTQSFDVEPDITVLVGMNESGKTSILEALAKVNYFEDDENFKFNLSHDYPRKQKKAVDKSKENPSAVSLDFVISDSLAQKITSDIGVELKSKKFTITKKYDATKSWLFFWVSTKDFAFVKAKTLKIENKTIIDGLSNITNPTFPDFDAFIKSLDSNTYAEEIEKLNTLKKYFINPWAKHPIDGYICSTYLIPNLPKFMYYDDYYMLPSRVKLNDIDRNNPAEPSEKTAKALLELADIDITKVIKSNDFEDFIAELEATQAIISDELFKYWSTNRNLEIIFQIDKKEGKDARNNPSIVEHILDIRVKNKRSSVSLPLENRSKGFNWFFSFLVWFKKIQENKDNTYILLLDEPGLNLHAKAQSDLLRFLTDLSINYQIIYTTHSPFMVEPGKLNQVRTVVEEENGTRISESVQEKDPNTLFPLQAALGYDLAQNLFVSAKNLIVEGVADLVYLNLLSEMLQSLGREGLKNDITIVPVGGADKVATFVSLLRGNKLNIVCLLDTFTDMSAKQRLDNMITQKIIKDKKVVFYHDILNSSYADVEDLFEISDYLDVYNGAFSKALNATNFDSTKPILVQIKKSNGNKDFNHYTPANYLAKNIAGIVFSDTTLNNFENLFNKINKLL